jgi:hypothetical protein
VLSSPGTGNLFAGVSAGSSNTGSSNSFFGSLAGSSNTTGGDNSFFGSNAGANNTAGSSNAFVGTNAGAANNAGGANVFIGHLAGGVNTTGSFNTAIGFDTAFNVNNLTNATAIGAQSRVGASDRMVLGRPGTNVVIGNNGAGTGLLQSNARLNIFGGPNWTTSGWHSALKLENAAAIGWDANVGTHFGIGASAGAIYFFRTFEPVGQSSTSAQYDMMITEGGRVGIGITNLAFLPQQTLHVNGRARVGSIPLEASVAQVCFNQAGDLLQCGASSMKWKTDVHPFRSGLDTLLKLRPISFNWKESGTADIGLGAEDVAAAAPELALRDADGNIAGVKYDKLNIVLINAVREQQRQIDALRAELKVQKKIINRLQTRRHRATRGRR